MAEIDLNTYIEANKNICALNCIKFYLWYGKTFEDSLTTREFVQNNEYGAFSAYDKLLWEAARQELVKMSKDINYFKKCLKKDKDIIVSPHYNSLNEYVKVEFETNKTIDELHSIVCSNVMNLHQELTNETKDNEEIELDI